MLLETQLHLKQRRKNLDLFWYEDEILAGVLFFINTNAIVFQFITFHALIYILINTCYAFRAILRRGIKYNWFQRPVVDHWGLRRHALVNLWRTGGETLVNKPGMVRNIYCILIYVPNVIGEVVKTSNFPDMSSSFIKKYKLEIKFYLFWKGYLPPPLLHLIFFSKQNLRIRTLHVLIHQYSSTYTVANSC